MAETVDVVVVGGGQAVDEDAVRIAWTVHGRGTRWPGLA